VSTSLRLSSTIFISTITCAFGYMRSSNSARAGSTLEIAPFSSAVLLCESKPILSTANVCCTAVTAALKSCGFVISGTRTSTAMWGSSSARFCGVSRATRNRLLVSGTTKEPVAASSPCSA
jgi:hypothetical protein